MKFNIKRTTKNLFCRFYRRSTHPEMIKVFARKQMKGFGPGPIFVETGAGISTPALSEVASECNGKVYSCDFNDDMVKELNKRASDRLENVNFLIGDSLGSLREIVEKHDRIDFAFLDSAASATHTFREFQIIEPCLKSGSCLLIDNAALPEAKLLLSPCRKGKIIVPYLLASPYWKVQAHPRQGDSMITAVYFDEPEYADGRYERPGNLEYWQSHFKANL